MFPFQEDLIFWTSFYVDIKFGNISCICKVQILFNIKSCLNKKLFKDIEYFLKYLSNY